MSRTGLYYCASRVAVACGVVGTLLFLGATAARANEPANHAQVEFFEKQVRPLLVERCGKCHGEQPKPKGMLRLTSRAHVLEGGESGTAAVPGKPDESLLITAVRYRDEPKMPPDAKLNDAEIGILERWVKEGLVWTDAPAPTIAGGGEYKITDEQRKYWAYQPVHVTPPGPVQNAAWSRSPIDQYLLAAMEAQHLAPAAQADKRTLLRRATFDLTGLPPTPAEIDAFLADQSRDAFAKVVDRLLASPTYGQRWARHWLDVVRYTDSFDARILSGAGTEMDIQDSWRYRDWVVDAFNRDLPYDQFVQQQIAGDILASTDPGSFKTDAIIATGVLAMGNWGGGDADKDKLLTDIADDQVDLVGRAFLGLTIACARCHDHKFDPIPTADYYGLAGIFFSSHILRDPGPKTNGPPMLRIPLVSPAEQDKRKRADARLAQLRTEMQQLLDRERTTIANAEVSHTAAYLQATYRAQRGEKVADVAQQTGLNAGVLQGWIDFLSVDSGKLLTTIVPNLFGNSGLFGLHGQTDNPSATVNTTPNELKFISITLPGKSVAVHPSPNGGVAAEWRSPIAGNLRVSGKITDADGTCGNGVVWRLEHFHAGTVRRLAEGQIPNGGSQPLATDAAATALASVPVSQGDALRLVILPNGEYSCDSTKIDLDLVEQGGAGNHWNLAEELVQSPPELSNPRADRSGHAGVWRFIDVGASAFAQVPSDSALGAWVGLTSKASAPGAATPDTAALTTAAELVQAALEHPPADGPNAKLLALLRAPGGPLAIQDVEARLAGEQRTKLTRLRTEIASLEKEVAAPMSFANGCLEGGCPQSPHEGTHDVAIHIRGRYDRLGPLVSRHFPTILGGDREPPIKAGSGRLELARWITKPDNPSTARVMVNRIWQHHFGKGIVGTAGNFGKLGEKPTHPELLDYLADSFVRSGWSIKSMHRQIMLSAAYQQSSQANPAMVKADPDNKYLSRMNRQRLEAEAIRDSLLAVSGTLNPALGGPATRELGSDRRTLYLMTVRSDRSTFRELFDAADSTAIVDRRSESTVAPQALFMLNNPFPRAQASALAERVVREEPQTVRGKLDRLYTLIYGRPPGEAEWKVAEAALGTTPTLDAWIEYCHVLVCSNEFLYVD